MPSVLSSAAAFKDFVSLRPTTAMSAPASASPRAIPSPMPPLPPVTMATLPERSKGAFFMTRFPPGWSALALPDQDQAKRGHDRAISRPLDLLDHEARLRPVDHSGALTDPEQAHREREKSDDQKQLSHGAIPLRASRAAQCYISRVARSLACSKGDEAVLPELTLAKAQKSPGPSRGFSLEASCKSVARGNRRAGPVEAVDQRGADGLDRGFEGNCRARQAGQDIRRSFRLG